MRRLLFFVSAFVMMFLFQPQAGAKVVLPSLFTDGMVVQRGTPVPVWGWADPGEEVVVKWGKKSYAVTADDQGCWRVDLPKMKAGGPFVLSVADITLTDVWVGDVWLCSGQSNVDIDLERVYPQYPDEIDNDESGMVRLIQVANMPVLDSPARDVKMTDGWQKLSKNTAWKFSALGYFLGKRMQQTTGVAQGIIQSSWGGTPIEAWLPVDSMEHYDPRAVAEARMMQDADLVSSMQRMNDLANNRWHQQADQSDPGVSQGWTSPDYDDSRWTVADRYDLPTAYARNFCGTYWLRQHIRVDAAHAGQTARLLVGTLYDADFTYVNGREVGRTYYQYPPRRYQVPEGLLREGDNVIAVRIVNKNGRPRFYHDKPMRMEFSDGTVLPLADNWLVSDGVQMPRQPSVDISLQNKATVLWNGMLSGLAPYALSGVVWYQGESNTGRAAEYEALLGCLMKSWRQLFQQPDLPFAIVQLANYMQPSAQPQNSQWARLRESQHRAALNDDRAELAVAIDLGEASDIHPLRKKEVAERCALCFDRLVFGKTVELSPEVVGMAVDSGRVVITFDQPLTPGVTCGFEVADGSGHFHTVDAQAEGSTVVLTAGQAVKVVRYAWKDNPVEANVRAEHTGLPAVPFERRVE